MLEHTLIFILGAVVGSFLNVVILRYNSGESFLKGGSRCFSCGKNLRWYELVPIVSFLIQKGRCRNCGSKISWQYPIIEITTGLLFLLIFNLAYRQTGLEFLIFKLICYWLLTSLLVIIAVYDLRHKIIPEFLVWLFNGLAFLGIYLFNRNAISFGSFGGFILSGLAFASFFALLWLVSGGRWMGLGDAKLALGIGWLLGPAKTFSAFLVSFWLGALVGLLLLLFKKEKYSMASQIPFAPFLIAGFFLALFINFDLFSLFQI